MTNDDDDDDDDDDRNRGLRALSTTVHEYKPKICQRLFISFDGLKPTLQENQHKQSYLQPENQTLIRTFGFMIEDMLGSSDQTINPKIQTVGLGFWLFGYASLHYDFLFSITPWHIFGGDRETKDMMRQGVIGK